MGWTTVDMAAWLRDELKLPAVADAGIEHELDGPMASHMLREDWLELGAPSLKIAKILGGLQKLQD